MAQFVPYNENVEVNGTKNAQPREWYNQKVWLDSFKAMMPLPNN